MVEAVDEVDSLVVSAELDGTLILSMAVPIPSPPAASTMNAPTTAATTPTLDERRVAVFSSSVGSASNGVEKAGTGAGLRDGSAGITA
ncbi:hypothetical protein QV65_07715, partial [Rhodococcus erythropolis]